MSVCSENYSVPACSTELPELLLMKSRTNAERKYRERSHCDGSQPPVGISCLPMGCTTAAGESLLWWLEQLFLLLLHWSQCLQSCVSSKFSFFSSAAVIQQLFPCLNVLSQSCLSQCWVCLGQNWLCGTQGTSGSLSQKWPLQHPLLPEPHRANPVLHSLNRTNRGRGWFCVLDAAAALWGWQSHSQTNKGICCFTAGLLLGTEVLISLLHWLWETEVFFDHLSVQIPEQPLCSRLCILLQHTLAH